MEREDNTNPRTEFVAHCAACGHEWELSLGWLLSGNPVECFKCHSQLLRAALDPGPSLLGCEDLIPDTAD